MTSSVVHFELPADDVERAKKFYEQAFGWTMRSMPGMGYTLVGTTATDEQGMPVAAGAINGGMLARQAPITGQPGLPGVSTTRRSPASAWMKPRRVRTAR